MSPSITLLMLSRMGAGDGGRETWLANFLDEVVRQRRDFSIEAIHQQADGKTLLDAPSRRDLVLAVQQVNIRWPWCPVSIEFLARLAFGGVRAKRGSPVLAVGGLPEAIGALLLTPLRGRRSRIMWLRSIYTREKSAQLPGLSKRLVLTFEKLVLRRFGTVVANGEDTAAFYRAIGIDSTVIPNAVPLQKWAMPPPAESSRLRVAYVGRLAEVKGIVPFLQAVEECERTEPGRCEFHVAGEGPARDRVEAMASSFPLVYHGQVDNEAAFGIVRGCDACVALTLSSPTLGGGGVSNALIEQMAAGRILVAWNNDIFQQVLDPDAAYLVPQGDYAALAQALLHVAANRNEALQRAARARQASERYSIGRHVDSFFELIDQSEEAAS